MIQSKYAQFGDDQPFYFMFDSEKKDILLIDESVVVARFTNGEWKEVPPHTIARGDVRDITKEEFDTVTGGKFPDVDPKQVMDL